MYVLIISFINNKSSCIGIRDVSCTVPMSLFVVLPIIGLLPCDKRTNKNKWWGYRFIIIKYKHLNSYRSGTVVPNANTVKEGKLLVLTHNRGITLKFKMKYSNQ